MFTAKIYFIVVMHSGLVVSASYSRLRGQDSSSTGTWTACSTVLKVASHPHLVPGQLVPSPLGGKPPSSGTWTACP